MLSLHRLRDRTRGMTTPNLFERTEQVRVFHMPAVEGREFMAPLVNGLVNGLADAVEDRPSPDDDAASAGAALDTSVQGIR
jgi:hypothetical protein